MAFARTAATGTIRIAEDETDHHGLALHGIHRFPGPSIPGWWKRAQDYNRNYEYEMKVEGNRVLDKNYKTRYHLEGNRIYYENYRYQGKIEGNKIYDRNYQYQGKIKGDKVYDRDYRLKYHLKK